MSALELKWSDESVWKKIRDLKPGEVPAMVIEAAYLTERDSARRYGHKFTAEFRVTE